MKNSIKVELKEYILEGMQELKIDNLTSKPGRLDANELHQALFNEDYYIIGYFNAQKWLDKHFINTFEALEEIKDYELDNFGEAKHYTDAESLVNMLAYIYGEQLIQECFEEVGLM